MEPRTASRMPAPHDLAKTLRFRREEITTKFTREAIDADDTVPVELYSRPYERLELQPDSRPYERIEISFSASPATEVPADLVDHAPGSELRLVVTFLILSATFALGVGFAFLVR